MKKAKFFLAYGGFCREMSPDEYPYDKEIVKECPFKDGHPHDLKVKLLYRRLRTKKGLQKRHLHSVTVDIFDKGKNEVYHSVIPYQFIEIRR